MPFHFAMPSIYSFHPSVTTSISDSGFIHLFRHKLDHAYAYSRHWTLAHTLLVLSIPGYPCCIIYCFVLFRWYTCHFLSPLQSCSTRYTKRPLADKLFLSIGTGGCDRLKRRFSFSLRDHHLSNADTGTCSLSFNPLEWTLCQIEFFVTRSPLASFMVQDWHICHGHFTHIDVEFRMKTRMGNTWYFSGKNTYELREDEVMGLQNHAVCSHFLQR